MSKAELCQLRYTQADVSGGDDLQSPNSEISSQQETLLTQNLVFSTHHS